MKSYKEIEVRYQETDQMGVVHHSNYIIWFELGRIKFLEDIGFSYKEIEDCGVLYPIKHVEVSYLKPVKFGEHVLLETTVESFTKVKTIYKHRVYNDKNELKVLGRTTIVSVDKLTFKPVRMDKVLPELYKKYLDLL